MIKPIEKLAIFLVFTNLGIWIYNYNKILDISSIIGGIVSLLFGYFIVYAILWTCMEYYANNLLDETVEYFRKNYQMAKIKFRSNFYLSILRKYTTFILILFLLLDSFSLFKFKFSVLSVVNTFINNNYE